jgi:hypothetical protein
MNTPRVVADALVGLRVNSERDCVRMETAAATVKKVRESWWRTV